MTCSASVQDMRHLQFAHKQIEDTLRKSIFEVLMKFAFPVSNGLVSSHQPHCPEVIFYNHGPVCHILCSKSLPLITDKSFLKMDGRCTMLSRSTKDRSAKGMWLVDIAMAFLKKKKKKSSPFLCFKGYTQWKLEDNEGKRPLRSLWHLPVNFSGTCQHTRRRTEEGGCLPCKRKDTRESVAQIQYPLVMEHLCWNCVAHYITGAVVDPPREPGDGDALQSAHGWGKWETEQRGWEVPPGNHGC